MLASKKRNNKKRLYLDFPILSHTFLQPNSKYVYRGKSNQLIIIPSSDGTGNTVCQKVKNGTSVPVIDIRSQKALAVFAGCEELQIDIYEDKVIVTGIKPQETNRADGKEQKTNRVSGFLQSCAKLFSFGHFLQKKQTVSAAIPLHELRMAAGGMEQLQWDLFQTEEHTSSSVVDIHSKLANTDISIPLQVLSLFSGAGVMDSGFLKEGFTISYAIDSDPDAVKTYQYNIGNHIVEGNIEHAVFPKLPIVIGGIPCKAFSNVNRIKRLEEHPDFLLYLQYIRAVKESECLVFAIENVPPFLTAHDGLVLRTLQKELGEYELTSGIYDTVKFGVPQSRKRAVIIGSKIGPISFVEPDLSAEQYQTVGDAFLGLTNDIPNQLDQIRSKPKNQELFGYVPIGGNCQDVPAEIRPSSVASNFMKRLDPWKPSITIPDFSKAMILHPFLNRVISVREAARLFGIDDDFVFCGRPSKRVGQVGNAVPVPFAQAIARTIKHAVQRFNLRNRGAGLALV